MSFIFLVVDKALTASFIEAADDKATRSRQCHELGKTHISVKTIPVRKYMTPYMPKVEVVELPKVEGNSKLTWLHFASSPFGKFDPTTDTLYRTSINAWNVFQIYDAYRGWILQDPAKAIWGNELTEDEAKHIILNVITPYYMDRAEKAEIVPKIQKIRYYVDDKDTPDIMFRVTEFSDVPDLFEWISRHSRNWTQDEDPAGTPMDPEYWTELNDSDDIQKAFDYLQTFWDKNSERKIPKEPEVRSYAPEPDVANTLKTLWDQHRDKRVAAAKVLDKAIDTRVTNVLHDAGVPRTATAVLLDLKDKAIEELKK